MPGTAEAAKDVQGADLFWSYMQCKTTPTRGEMITHVAALRHCLIFEQPTQMTQNKQRDIDIVKDKDGKERCIYLFLFQASSGWLKISIDTVYRH